MWWELNITRFVKSKCATNLYSCTPDDKLPEKCPIHVSTTENDFIHGKQNVFSCLASNCTILRLLTDTQTHTGASVCDNGQLIRQINICIATNNHPALRLTDLVSASDVCPSLHDSIPFLIFLPLPLNFKCPLASRSRVTRGRVWKCPPLKWESCCQ